MSYLEVLAELFQLDQVPRVAAIENQKNEGIHNGLPDFYLSK